MLIVLLFVTECSFAQNDDVIATQLDGLWEVDLRPTPEADAYLKDFKMQVTADNKLSGTFYDTSFTDGLINSNWERVYFAFQTKDASNTYYHTGYYLEGAIYGSTYCPNRNFIIPWTGFKKEQ